MNSSRKSCILDESVISLSSASSLSFDAEGRETSHEQDLASQSCDLTLTSFEEDEDNDVTLSDASLIVDFTITHYSNVSISEVLPVAEEHCKGNRQRTSTHGSQAHSIPSTTKIFKPSKHSTPKKSASTDQQHAQQSIAVLQKTVHVNDTVDTSAASGLKLDLSNDLDLKWSLHVTVAMSGCAEQCVKKIHQLNEHSVLRAHSHFKDKTISEQNSWIIQYFECHCPLNEVHGEKDVKSISYIIQGKQVCLAAWIQILGITQSRFYRIREEYKVDGGIKYLCNNQQHGHCPKTMQAIAWMDQYFQRIGDKRPDSEGIYLPSCLTRKKMFEILSEELYNGEVSNGISYAMFCTLYADEFKHVTIPKVSSLSDCSILCVNTCLI